MSLKLFENASHACLYSKYRPTYPKSLLDMLLDYISRNGAGRDLAVDVACGSGQGTFQLQNHFSRCIGVDISSAQINAAQEKAREGNHDSLTFMVGDAAYLPFKASTVDLVTIAQAWHWLPSVDKFYSECKRVLKPRVCLAVYGYGNVCLHDESCNLLVSNFYAKTLEGCWHEKRRHIDNNFSEVILPFINTERHDWVMSREMMLGDFIGYISSWSGYQKYCKLNPNNSVLEELQMNIMTILSGSSTSNNDQVKVSMEFPVFAFVGQNS